jgi:hypothetical protein
VRNRYRSFFWPGLLILVGVFALLINAGLLPTDRLYRLADLWPVILIVFGLELIARRALHGGAADLAGALIVLIAAGGAVAYVAAGPAIPGGTHVLDSSGAVGELDQANLHIEAGAATITIKGTGSLGTDLYRAHIEYSGPKPDVSLDRLSGNLTITQSSVFGLFQSRRLSLDLQINTNVRWKIEADTGAATETFDLTDAKVGSIDINTGASHDEIVLGAPSGTVPVTINGGALTVKLHRRPGTAASIQVSGGAISLSADGREIHGVGSQRWRSDGYDQAGSRYQIEINGGACNVTMDTTGSPA